MVARQEEFGYPDGSYASQQQHLLLFAEELKRFAKDPSVDNRRIIEEQSHILPRRIATLWRSQPVVERVSGDLMGKHEEVLRLLGGVGRYSLEASPTTLIRGESDDLWPVVDGLLGGSFRGGVMQKFVLDADSKMLTLESVMGQAGLTLDLNDPHDVNMYLTSYNPNGDNSHIHQANVILNTFSISEGGENAQRFRRANAFLSTMRRAIIRNSTRLAAA